MEREVYNEREYLEMAMYVRGRYVREFMGMEGKLRGGGGV